MSQPSIGLIIIEINEPTTSATPVKFYFDEIAESNNATSSAFKQLTPKNTLPGHLCSHEMVSGDHEMDGKVFKFRLALMRFEEPYKTDIVIHMRSENEDE
mgnify:CR=1 FL=1